MQIWKILLLAVIVVLSGKTVRGDDGNLNELCAPGISRALARMRAQQYSDIHYLLRYNIIPGAEDLNGHVGIYITIAEPIKPMILDFKGLGNQPQDINGKLLQLEVNGQKISDYQQINGHIIIPAKPLKKGVNFLVIYFTCPARKSGAAITRYIDQDDKSEYIYSLFVPSDASMAFPCFDQPDLKARFIFSATAPKGWQIISNTPLQTAVDDTYRGEITPPMGYAWFRFQETKPISTYLFAFAAGPFVEMPAQGSDLPMSIYARRSKANKLAAEFNEIVRINREGVAALAQYFDYPFPFPKYDLVILPEFAYGGMEHAGATFLREDRILFPNDPTPNDLLIRAEVMLHEAAHQWFGDLVTMRWFDDLWLKEGFATFMAYHAMEKVLPGQDIWKLFYQKNKPRAYSTDGTKGTTPIFQEIPNLKDAKSAYGNIVYTKAPSMLRQFEFYLGPQVFQSGVRQFLKQHEFSNAEWSDLIHACEAASHRSLADWADVWVKRRGMAAVAPTIEYDTDGKIKRLALKQHNVLGEGRFWPLKIELLLAYQDRAPEVLTVTLNGEITEVAAAAGKAKPEYIFANYHDYGYGQFLLDEGSLNYIIEHLHSIQDQFLRALLWGALWESTREAQLSPSRFIELACAELPQERDAITVQTVLTNTAAAFTHFLSSAQQEQIAAKLEATIFQGLMNNPDNGLRITYFRFAPLLVTSEAGRKQMKKILAGEIKLTGITIKPRDRWDIITALLAQNDEQAILLLAQEAERDKSDDGLRYAFVAAAARSKSEIKQDYFQRYLNDRELAENWIVASLPAFNAARQADLTLPYLKPALEALPRLKQQRKIFFINDWLDAFIGGQDSPAALAIVEQYLQQPGLEKDLRLKVLEAADRLERAVKIRAKFAQ